LSKRLGVLLAAAALFSALAQSPIAAQPLLSQANDPKTTFALKTVAEPVLVDMGARLSGIEFSALGRKFVLDLQSNDRIKAGLSPAEQGRLGGVRLYRGVLAGYQHSWARLAEHNGEISGVVWDGANLYNVEIRHEVLSFQRIDSAPDPLGGSFAGDIVDHGQSITLPTGVEVNASGKLDLPLYPGRTIELGLVADGPFVDAFGDNAELQMLSVMNVVDGIFLWQLGVQLSIAEIVLLDPADDPFTDSRSDAFLSQLSAYKTSSPELASLGLVHLFTGRNITSSDPARNVIGVANIGEAPRFSTSDCDGAVAASPACAAGASPSAEKEALRKVEAGLTEAPGGSAEIASMGETWRRASAMVSSQSSLKRVRFNLLRPSLRRTAGSISVQWRCGPVSTCTKRGPEKG
jgi:hypothetical protein